jgi:F-type H+-transporting ATPase subunit delta
MVGAVARRYATALYEIALRLGAVDEIDPQAKALERLFDDKLTRDFFMSPRIPPERKKQAFVTRLGDRLHPMLLSLLKLLVDKKRITQLPQIMRYFDMLTDRFHGVEEVTVVSAVPLTQQQQDMVIEQVRRFSQFGDFRRKFEVDGGVLGGVKVKLGDHLVIDGTLSSRLSEMQQRMYRYRHHGVGA